MEEEWRAVEGHPGYDVSNIGRVRSYWDHGGNLHETPRCILKGNPKPRNYLSYGLRLPDGSGKQKTVNAHRLVALAFIGPPPHPKAIVCHTNGDNHDNRVENLRWDTPKGNAADAIRHGVLLNGANINTAKLSDELVVAIRWLYANNRASQQQLAELFGVARTAIGAIVRGESWKYLWDTDHPSHGLR